MKLGLILQTRGPASRRETLLGCAMAADASAIDSLWLTEQFGLPPDPRRDRREPEAARSLDLLTVLPFIAEATSRIHLGTAVMVLPFRAPLLVARFAATLQDLSRGRLELGVGVGWKEHEFQALGVEMARRGERMNETLELLYRTFRDESVAWNGQELIANPQPPPPPVYIGGAPEHAFDRVLRHADGWLCTGSDPENLRTSIARLRDLAAEEGDKVPLVATVQTLPVLEPAHALEIACEYESAGADLLIHSSGYDTADEFKEIVDVLSRQIRPQLP